MTWILALLTALPLAAGTIYGLRRLVRGDIGRWCRAALLGALAIVLSFPHLTDQAVGTGEAYNYSLALADALTQLRAGEAPVFVGQTEYAWNGRIHPLRSAPYLFYLAGSIDALTGRSLTFWTVQNLSLVFSLGALVGLTYLALRNGANCPPGWALVLTTVYAFSPALLCSVFTQNLFMTIHAAVWVPVVFGALARQANYPSFGADAVLAIGVAGAWLAHPPVAAWVSLVAAALRLTLLIQHHDRRTWSGLVLSALFFGLLAAFVFVSVRNVGDEFALDADEGATRTKFEAAIFSTLVQSVPGAVLPVTRNAGALGDLQFGYCAWALLIYAAWRCQYQTRDRAFRIVSILAVLSLVVLCLPVPGISRFLWSILPYQLLQLTNVWPMQRLYLVALGALVVAVGLNPPTGVLKRRYGAWTAALLFCAWGAWQAWPFFGRALEQRWSPKATLASHQSGNIDLTVTSFAFLGIPPDYVAGPVDPALQFRFADRDGNPMPSLRDQLSQRATQVGRGSVKRSDDPNGTATHWESGPLILEPGRRYLLKCEFPAGEFDGSLLLRGSMLERTYALPSAGETLAFGIGEEHGNTISLWTDQTEPETIRVSVALNPQVDDPQPAIGSTLLEFRWLTIDETSRPLTVHSWLPLRFETNFPEQGCWVITPRRFQPDYRATIDGLDYEPQRSPDGSLMIPVGAGKRQVEIRYVGRAPVVASFWLSTAGWLAVGLGSLGRAVAGPRLKLGLSTKGQELVSFASLTALIGVWSSVTGNEPNFTARQTGDMQLRLFLPVGRSSGSAESLLSTGERGAGTVTYLTYVDGAHLRVGAEIWGQRLESDLIPVDYFAAQTIRIEALGLTSARSRAPDARLRVWVNNRLALESTGPDFPSRPDQVVIGRNALGSSVVRDDFSGQIASIERIPRPTLDWWPTNRALRVFLNPGSLSVGDSRTLFTVGRGESSGTARLIRPEAHAYRLAWNAPDGTHREAQLPKAASRHGWDLRVMLRGNAHRPSTWQLSAELGDTPLWSQIETEERRAPVDLCIHTLPPGEGSILAVVAPTTESVRSEQIIRIAVRLPQNAIGTREPLLVTGKTGAGDAVYLIYEDSRTLKVGFDHWGVGGAISESIPIDYAAPHVFEIRSSALRAFAPDAEAAGSEASDGVVTVAIDGVQVLQAEFSPYPATAEQLYFGQNGIDSSTSGPAFTGKILGIERAPERKTGKSAGG